MIVEVQPPEPLFTFTAKGDTMILDLTQSLVLGKAECIDVMRKIVRFVFLYEEWE